VHACRKIVTSGFLDEVRDEAIGQKYAKHLLNRQDASKPGKAPSKNWTQEGTCLVLSQDIEKSARYRSKTHFYILQCWILIAHPVYQPVSACLNLSIGSKVARFCAKKSRRLPAILFLFQISRCWVSFNCNFLRHICEICSAASKPKFSDHLVRSSCSSKTAVHH
jgi:hypothetical protein